MLSLTLKYLEDDSFSTGEGFVREGGARLSGGMMKRALIRGSALLVTAFFLVSALGITAADPLQDKKNELERIKNEVQRIDAQLEAVTEQYNLTRIRVEQAREAIAEKEAQIAELNAELRERQDILGRRLRELYKAGNADVIEVILDCNSVEDLLVNVDMARRIGGGDVAVISSVLDARQEVEAARRDLEAKKAELDAALADLERQKQSIEADLQRRRELMAGVENEVNSLIAREEANRAAAPTRSAPATPRRSTPPPPSPPYAPRVVQVAYQQLGKPYRYAGSGPDVFDCSGLVMYCYAQVGVRLPHSSYLQARCGVPVSYAELQPGDLVFFHGYGHVGIYIGNGQYIHAPRTGDVVRIADLSRRRDFCGACRIIY
jgi:cell wall-associated NlpC family hydrolase